MARWTTEVRYITGRGRDGEGPVDGPETWIRDGIQRRGLKRRTGKKRHSQVLSVIRLGVERGVNELRLLVVHPGVPSAVDGVLRGGRWPCGLLDVVVVGDRGEGRAAAKRAGQANAIADPTLQLASPPIVSQNPAPARITRTPVRGSGSPSHPSRPSLSSACAVVLCIVFFQRRRRSRWQPLGVEWAGCSHGSRLWTQAGAVLPLLATLSPSPWVAIAER